MQPDAVNTPTRTAGVIDATIGRLARPLLELSSTLRRRGVVHPSGLLVEGRVVVNGDDAYAGTMLGEAHQFRALVRFSRTLGAPEPGPDIGFGIAVRMFDADGSGGIQDLLLLSSSPAPGARQAILPAQGHAPAFSSSITPLRIAGHQRLLGARPQGDRIGHLPRLAQVARAVTAGQLAFELVAASTFGTWSPIGRLRLDEAAPPGTPRPDYNPFNEAGGLEPVGALNGLRRRAYLGSQDARTR